MTTQKCSYSPEPEEDEDLFCGNIGGQDAKVGCFLDIYILYYRLYIFPEYIGQEESKYKTPIPGSHNLRGFNIYRS